MGCMSRGRQRFSAAAVIFLLAAVLPCVAHARSVTLGDAIELAFENNEEIRSQQGEVKAADAVKIGAEGKFTPRLSLGAAYTHNDFVITLPPSFVVGQAKDPGIFLGYNNQYNFSINAEQSIFAGGKDVAGYKESSLKEKVQQQGLRAKMLSAELETKRLYFGLMLADETLRITHELVDQTEKHCRDVQRKFGEGTSSRFDLLQSKVQVAKVEPQLAAAEKARELISAELKKYIGIKFEEELVPTQKLSYAHFDVSEDASQAEALAGNPELAMKALGVDVGKQGVNSARAGYLPDVRATFRYDFISNDVTNMFNDTHNNWNAGVAISIPIFDGFSAYSKTKEAKARMEIAKLERSDLEKGVAIDVKRACLDLIEAEKVILAQRASVEEAREALKIANTSYDAGVGTNLDVLDAQVSLSQVEKNLSEAIYDYTMAKATLDRTTGRNTFAEVQNEKTR